MIILIILIIVLLLSLSLINKTFKKKDNVLEDVKLQENTIKNDGFALMLQQEDGTYKEDTSSTWPTDMKFNSELSGCIDVNGNKIDNSLSYDNDSKLVTVQTNKTSFCYVYFDINAFCEKNETLSNCIIRNSNEGVEEIWNSPLEEDGYRYVGTDPDNYICFGTADKDTCVNDPDKYMYRIIGVFEDDVGNNHTKLIKKERVHDLQGFGFIKWHSDGQTDVDWNESDLYKGINGEYFLTNTEYSYMQDSNWTNKIATWNYTMTNTKTWENYSETGTYGPNYTYETGKTMYLHELNRNGKSSESCHFNDDTLADCNVGEWKMLSTKISLMYASDYALSLGEPALKYVGDIDFETMETGWMHNNNEDYDAYDWTMTRTGYYFAIEEDDYEAYYTLLVHTQGAVISMFVDAKFEARPVFYLESNVEISGGTGTISDPYIIKN